MAKDIHEIKKALSITINLFKEVRKVLDDGKLTFFEGVGLIPELKEFSTLAPKLKVIVEEFKDLDAGEFVEIIHMLRSELDTSKEDVKDLIESSSDWLISSYNLIEHVKKVK